MKMSRYEIQQTFIGWGKFILFLPVMSIFAAGFLCLGSSLDALITGQTNADNISPLLSIAIMAVYTFVCIRMGWADLHFRTIVLCIFMLLTDSSMYFFTKILMGILAIAIMILSIKVQGPRTTSWKPRQKSVRKNAGKAVVRPVAAPVSKPVSDPLPPDAERRFWATLAKLPSNPDAVRSAFSGMSQSELAKRIKESPRDLFRLAPYRENLLYIYGEMPEHAMVLVDMFLKFDAQGKLIDY